MFICLYVYMFICLYIYIYIYLYLYICRMYIYIYIYIYMSQLFLPDSCNSCQGRSRLDEHVFVRAQPVREDFDRLDSAMA